MHTYIHTYIHKFNIQGSESKPSPILSAMKDYIKGSGMMHVCVYVCMYACMYACMTMHSCMAEFFKLVQVESMLVCKYEGMRICMYVDMKDTPTNL
jgi:hypothetical protein